MKPTKSKQKARLPRKGTVRRRLHDLYRHVTVVCGHEPSEVIREMWKVVEERAVSWPKGWDPFRALRLRFGPKNEEPWTWEGNPFVWVNSFEVLEGGAGV